MYHESMADPKVHKITLKEIQDGPEGDIIHSWLGAVCSGPNERDENLTDHWAWVTCEKCLRSMEGKAYFSCEKRLN